MGIWLGGGLKMGGVTLWEPSIHIHNEPIKIVILFEYIIF